MIWLWVAMVVIGLGLSTWATMALPKGTDMMPRPPIKRITTGPYRFLKHPMYVGNVMFVAGLGGIAAGVWNFMAVGFTAIMLMQYWSALEDGR